MDLERINYGEAPDDHKGMDVRNLCILLDNNFVALVEYLTGGAQQSGRLNKGLPVERGGTGAESAMQARINLGLVTGPNNELVFGNHSVEVYDTGYRIHGKVNNDFAFTKVSTGVYTLSGLTSPNYGTGFKMLLPKDELGNVLVGAVLSAAEGVATIKVHPIVYTAGKASMNTAVAADIPSGRFVSFNIS